MVTDSIYLKRKEVKDFKFDENVSEVFDDMVSRSIPYYHDSQKLVVDFIRRNLVNDTNIYDLGCATGTTMILLNNTLKDKSVKFFGVDNSESMLTKAKKKITKHVKEHEKFILINKDISKLEDFNNPGCFILNLTLQFIRPANRQDIINNLYKQLPTGGICVLFEKLVDEHSQFNRSYINMYYDFKRQNNYSDIEISRKREELENILIPYTEKENYSLLENSGTS